MYLLYIDDAGTIDLKKDESIDISCLPTQWTYTISETDPGSNFKVYYKFNEETKSEGKTVSSIMTKTGKMSIEFNSTTRDRNFI